MATERDPAIVKVCSLLGNASRLAEVCGVSRAAVSRWRRIPPRHLRTVSDLTGLKFEALRPDLFGRGPH